MPEAASIESRLASLEARLAEVIVERDQYKALYLKTLELCRKLERGLTGQQREKFSTGDSQLTMSVLGLLLGGETQPPPVPAAPAAPEPFKPRALPTGRRPLPAYLPRVEIVIQPPEVEKQGLDAFVCVGEDVSEMVEKRPSSLVVVRVKRPKYVLKGRAEKAGTEFFQGAPPELPIERGLGGPGLLAETIVRRWEDHLPLHRMERIYGREGLELARSTVCGWHAELAELVKPLIDSMWKDALTAPYLCTDATGVLVQETEKCRRGHFWVVAAPEKHVLFRYTPSHDSAAVDASLAGYKGFLVADAHAVFDHLYKSGDVVECGCWAHARRYWFKALLTDPDRAQHALAIIRELFLLEREISSMSAETRKLVRLQRAKPIVNAFFKFCEEQQALVLDQTPSAKAITYALNQRSALERFFDDGRLPIHNNFSERELRREAVGRKNWLFVGNDDGGEVNAAFVTLLASCRLHGLEPWSYLRDLLCLIPSWPKSRVLELSPARWTQTLQQEDAQQRLAANAFRAVSLADGGHLQPS